MKLLTDIPSHFKRRTHSFPSPTHRTLPPMSPRRLTRSFWYFHTTNGSHRIRSHLLIPLNPRSLLLRKRHNYINRLGFPLPTRPRSFRSSLELHVRFGY